MLLLLLSTEKGLHSQSKTASPIKVSYISLLSGVDYNISTQTPGLHFKLLIPTKSIIDISISYSNFSSERLSERYFGFGVNGNIFKKDKFIISPGILLEYNVWEDFFLFNNPLAKKNTVLASPNLCLEYNYKSIKIENQTGYNIIWSEWRTQMLIGLNIGYLFTPH